MHNFDLKLQDWDKGECYPHEQNFPDCRSLWSVKLHHRKICSSGRKISQSAMQWRVITASLARPHKLLIATTLTKWSPSQHPAPAVHQVICALGTSVMHLGISLLATVCDRHSSSVLTMPAHGHLQSENRGVEAVCCGIRCTHVIQLVQVNPTTCSCSVSCLLV